MRVGSLFSGIGGIDLGLERAGMRVAWQSEVDPYACAVLRRHWPDVPNLGDVRAIREAPAVDLVAGGFPCQDINSAGKGAGIDGERSGLWFEMLRLIGGCRPRWVLAENVPALRTRGADVVLDGLERAGYACWPLVVGADDVGAPHRRKRVWIVAYANGERLQGERRARLLDGERQTFGHDADGCGGAVSDAERDLLRHEQQRRPGRWARGVCDEGQAKLGDDGADELLADSSGSGLQVSEREERRGEGRRIEGGATAKRGWWSVEPDVGRVAHGIPRRVDRLRCLGNAVVPQVVEVIGRAILSVDRLR